MSELVRRATAVWRGDLRNGTGETSTSSGALRQAKVSWPSRFESGEGTNPEELIAAAHASCFSMALAARLAQEGYPPEEVQAEAAVTLRAGEGWPRITAVQLEVEVRVPGIEEEKFRRAVEDAKEGCPVSALVSPGLESLTVNVHRRA